MDGFLDDLPVDEDLGFGNLKKRKKKSDVIIYHKIRCPKCGGGNVPIHTTRKRIRYHKCDDCGHNFKSIEA